ncbi:MAG: helix-turn-helix domain-containing protein [Patescibacteria group bacterium]
MIAIHRPIIQHLIKSMQERINPYMTNGVIQFGKKLREARLKKKLSQGDVAKILGVHRTYISGLERGRRNPSLLTVQKIAKALGVPVENLLK